MPQTKPHIRNDKPLWPWLLAGGIGLALLGLYELGSYLQGHPLSIR